MWISPRGEIMMDASGTHIGIVMKSPEKFGLNTGDLKKIYTKYSETFSPDVEGKAREEIIVGLVDQGFIRLRRYPNKFWSINIKRLDKKVKDYLFDWANKVLDGLGSYKEKDKYMPVKLDLIDGSFGKSITVQSIANDVLFEGEIFDINNSLILKESIYDFEDYVL